MTLPNSWDWPSPSSDLRSLADGLPDLRADVDADDVEEDDHKHGEEGAKDHQLGTTI